jgi:hypothetical protein
LGFIRLTQLLPRADLLLQACIEIHDFICDRINLETYSWTFAVAPFLGVVSITLEAKIGRSDITVFESNVSWSSSHIG